MPKSIKGRLISFFIMILLIFTGSNIWALINFNSLSVSIDNIMESNYRSIEAAQNMIVAIERQDSAELAHMFSESDTTVSNFIENQKIFLRWLTRAEDNITETGEQEVLASINQNYTEYIDRFTYLISLNKEDDPKIMNDYYYQEIFPLFEETKEGSRELLAINQNSMLVRKDNAHNIARRAMISTVVVSVLSILFGLIIITILSNKIVAPIHNLIEKIKKIAEGNYNQKLSIEGDHEIAQLAKEFNQMATKLLYYDENNINKLKEEKNKSEAIVESISDGIIVTDKDNRIQLINYKAEKIFDIRENYCLNQHLLEVVNNEKLFGLFKEVNEHPYKKRYKSYEDIVVKVESVDKYYRVHVRPIKISNELHYGAVALIQDVTKFKEVDQMKSDFISTVSHEFRTPLTSITMGVGLLLEEIPGKLTEKQQELIEAIKEDSERLNTLVGELLDLSKLESGKMQMDFQNHQIEAVFDYTIKIFKIQCEEIEAEIIKNIPKQLSEVRIDISKMTWVISNLIGNAIRYLPKPGGKIELSIKEIYGKQIISVKDNGSGMSETMQKHIFEKFSQGKDLAGGAGLGLSICKEIIKAHGGDIWVESETGKGTTFFFTVPIVE